MITPEQVGSYAVLYLTGVECGGVHALQERVKQQGLIDSVNMRARKREGGGGGHVLANCPVYLAKARRLAWWQMAGRILELCCAGTQLAAIVTLEAQL